MKGLNVRKTLTIVGLVSFLGLTLSSTPGLAEQNMEEGLRQGLPGRRIGGGTRGEECIAGETPLIALMPENNLGVTTAANPSLLFYLPQATAARDVEFVLLDANDELIYDATFQVKGDSGIISLSLPNDESLPTLAKNENYHWYFSIICDPANRAQDIAVDGWLRRVDLAANLTHQLDNVSPLERARVLSQEPELWYEALTILADQRRTQPNNLTVAGQWTEHLQSVGLNSIAQESLIDIPLVTDSNELVSEML